MTKTTIHPRNPPPLSQLAPIIQSALQANFTHATATVSPCPNLRAAPFGLAAPGLSGNTRIADVGGQANLFPSPNFNAKYELLRLAECMDMNPKEGFLLGAGAAPFQDLGWNAELAPNLSWIARNQHGGEPSFNSPDSMDVKNETRVIEIVEKENDTETVHCRHSPSTNCALMANLFGCAGEPGPVLKIITRGRKGPPNFPNAIRTALLNAYGESHPISIGGVFLLKSGRAKFHVMPDFPAPEDLPFKDRKTLEEEWLRYHVCEAPVVCLTVFHSSDPEGLGLRMEHTHCFDLEGDKKGGHYHYDMQGEEDGDEVEYEAYLNVAEVVYRVDRA